MAIASPKHPHSSTNWSPSSSSSDKANDTPPPPSPQKSSWDIFNPFRPSSPPFNLQESRRKVRGRGASSHHNNRRYGYGYEGEAAPPARLEDEFDGNNGNALVKWERSNRDFATMVRTGGGERDLLDMVKELDERFLRASACGSAVSKVLETRKGHFLTEIADNKKASNVQSGSMFSSLSWNWPKNPLASNDDLNSLSSVAESELMGSHALTLERLCAWEKKLFDEVKGGENLRMEHQKKCILLRQQEGKGEEANVVDRTRAVIKRLRSQILVAFQAVESTTAAVKKMRDEELYPQLLDLSQGLMYMWRTMHECHALQKQVVLQFKNLDSWVAHEATSEYHHHATVELEKELANWHDCFCKLVSSQREYMTSLNGWARLSLLEIDYVDDFPNKENLHVIANEDSFPTSSPSPYKPPSPPTLSLCEEWQKSLDRLPDKVASEAIKSFVAVIHALVSQQSEELKHQKQVERLCKRLDKKIAALHVAERKQVEAAARTPVVHYAISKKSTTVDVEDFDEESISTDSERVSEDFSSATPAVAATARDPLVERRAEVEALKKKVEDERAKHGKCVQDTRVLTMNNLQTGLPGVFEAMTGFSAVCAQAFQGVYNNAGQGAEDHY